MCSIEFLVSGSSQIAGISIQTDGITKEATLSAVCICSHCTTR
jgi:hypothetical protein